jgi:mannose-6-phosphate isomerase-like protein (cupin superfamily)
VSDDRRRFHHERLPSFSALLSGRITPDNLAFQSESLQVWYNDRPAGTWADPGPHLHRQSDEMFVVLEGALLVSVHDENVRVGAGEFCCFPAGLLHELIAIETPLRTLMIRAPSVDDKVYPTESA